MKRNLDVQEIIRELQQESLLKRDFIFNSSSIKMNNGNFELHLPDIVSTGMNDLLKSLNIGSSETIYRTTPNKLCHEHISEKLKINKNYYDRMSNQKHFELLDHNVNYWMNTERNNYMLRTFINPNGNGGIARALLSDSYKTIDNWDVCITILDIIRKYPGIQLQAADITDRKFYMRFIDPSIEHQAPGLLRNYKNGNPGIVAGFVISNSEVGEGAFSIAPRALVLACTNGITRWDEKLRKVHLGSKMDHGYINWSNMTKQKNLELIQSQTADAISQWLSTDYLQNLTAWLTDIKQIKIQYPIDCTKNICKELKFDDAITERVISHYFHDGDHSALGIAQAVTHASLSFENADMQYESESKVYTLIENVKKYDKKEGTR